MVDPLEMTLGHRVSCISSHDQLGEFIAQPDVHLTTRQRHRAPAVPQEQFVTKAMSYVHDQIRENELRSREFCGWDADAEIVDRFPVLPVANPGGRGRQEWRVAIGTNVVRVGDASAWSGDSCVEPDPSISEPGLGDYVILTAAGSEVLSEPDSAPGRDAVLPQDPDRQQCLVTAASLDPVGLGTMVVQRSPVSLLIDIEDPAEPARIDVVVARGGQRNVREPVVGDCVLRNRAHAGKVAWHAGEQVGVPPRIGVVRVSRVVRIWPMPIA